MLLADPPTAAAEPCRPAATEAHRRIAPIDEASGSDRIARFLRAARQEVVERDEWAEGDGTRGLGQRSCRPGAAWDRLRLWRRAPDGEDWGDVGLWLRELGLGQYEQAFNDNAIDGEVLPRLTADHLKDRGVVAIGHPRRLLDAVNALRADGGPTPSSRRHAAVFASFEGFEAHALTLSELRPLNSARLIGITRGRPLGAPRGAAQLVVGSFPRRSSAGQPRRRVSQLATACPSGRRGGVGR